MIDTIDAVHVATLSSSHLRTIVISIPKPKRIDGAWSISDVTIASSVLSNDSTITGIEPRIASSIALSTAKSASAIVGAASLTAAAIAPRLFTNGFNAVMKSVSGTIINGKVNAKGMRARPNAASATAATARAALKPRITSAIFASFLLPVFSTFLNAFSSNGTTTAANMVIGGIAIVNAVARARMPRPASAILPPPSSDRIATRPAIAAMIVAIAPIAMNRFFGSSIESATRPGTSIVIAVATPSIAMPAAAIAFEFVPPLDICSRATIMPVMMRPKPATARVAVLTLSGGMSASIATAGTMRRNADAMALNTPPIAASSSFLSSAPASPRAASRKGKNDGGS